MAIDIYDCMYHDHFIILSQIEMAVVSVSALSGQFFEIKACINFSFIHSCKQYSGKKRNRG